MQWQLEASDLGASETAAEGQAPPLNHRAGTVLLLPELHSTCILIADALETLCNCISRASKLHPVPVMGGVQGCKA